MEDFCRELKDEVKNRTSIALHDDFHVDWSTKRLYGDINKTVSFFSFSTYDKEEIIPSLLKNREKVIKNAHIYLEKAEKTKKKIEAVSGEILRKVAKETIMTHFSFSLQPYPLYRELSEKSFGKKVSPYHLVLTYGETKRPLLSYWVHFESEKLVCSACWLPGEHKFHKFSNISDLKKPAFHQVFVELVTLFKRSIGR